MSIAKPPCAQLGPRNNRAMPLLRRSDPAPFSPPVLAGSLLLSGFAPVMRGTSGTLAAAVPLAAWAYHVEPGRLTLFALAGALCVVALAAGEWAIRSGVLKG